MAAGEGKVSPADLDLLSVADDPDEVVRIIVSAHRTGQDGAGAAPNGPAWPESAQAPRGEAG